MTYRAVLISTLTALVVLSGCASAPPLEHVMLAPPQDSHVPPKGSRWQVALVKMPEYLDSYDIRYRASDFVIDQLPNAKWAQRLPAGVTGLLQDTIDAKLETNRNKPYKVFVTIATFAPQPSGNVVLSARWHVTNEKTHSVVARDASLIKQPLSVKKYTPDDVGRAMSRAVRKLAYRIVAAAG